MFLPVLMVSTIVLFVVGIIVFYACMMKKHKKAYKHEMELFDNESGNIKEGGILLAERKLSCIRNYIIFQLANKVFGLASVIFSLMSFISLSVKTTDWLGMNVWLSYLIAFMSIVFVVLALYLSPTGRVAQYVAAWKECDKKMSEVITKLDKDTPEAGDIAETISRVESSITSDGE